ncbi:DNA alkylation repair protein [Leucobacter tardus]|uniref:DNA alkylation repair protein n=1 Tax=Leucobacter tardus TaxID=501483 RepID=A0A939TVM2_9MICO|nr:DNA alkylation repair protein [Leucobacter tardus]
MNPCRLPIGRDVARSLRRSLLAASPRAELGALALAADALTDLSLRERADLLRNAILDDVPGDFATLARVVRAARNQDPEFTGWMIWPVTSAVAARGVSEDRVAFDDAMQLLAELTGRLTAEFAIRTLLRHDPDRALGTMFEWTASPDEHVRRLASEGARPYLPWAVRVPELFARPGVTIPILDALVRDESEYVRRSVANHLNDLSRDHPDLVIDTAQRWIDIGSATTPALVRHALRTLVKRGHPGALAVLGFAPADIDVDGPHLDQSFVDWNGAVRFTAVLRNAGAEPARIVVDYAVHHRRANGTLAAKVFKLTTTELAPGAEIRIERAHSFRPITTRRYYPGEHAIGLQVNGVATPLTAFDLRPE